MKNEISSLCKDQNTLISNLKDMLRMAESGEMRSMAFVFESLTDDGDCLGNFIVVNDKTSVMSMLGEIELLKRDFIDCFTQTRRQPLWEYCE